MWEEFLAMSDSFLTRQISSVSKYLHTPCYFSLFNMSINCWLLSEITPQLLWEGFFHIAELCD